MRRLSVGTSANASAAAVSTTPISRRLCSHTAQFFSHCKAAATVPAQHRQAAGSCLPPYSKKRLPCCGGHLNSPCRARLALRRLCVGLTGPAASEEVDLAQPVALDLLCTPRLAQLSGHIALHTWRCHGHVRRSAEACLGTGSGAAGRCRLSCSALPAPLAPPPGKAEGSGLGPRSARAGCAAVQRAPRAHRTRVGRRLAPRGRQLLPQRCSLRLRRSQPRDHVL